MFFLARFVHRDMATWRVQLRAHMDWLAERANSGDVAASGPVVDEHGPLAAMILLRAEDRDTALAILATDPFVEHGVTEDLVVVGWNPFIGPFAAETEPPSRLSELLAE